MGNFIKVDRKILKWEWWGDINTCRLFLYMLISAYWKDGKYKGKDIFRGSFPSTLPQLAIDTNLTENEVRTAIKHLKSTGEITVKSHAKYSIYTVNNYNEYQSDNRQINSEITVKSQSDNSQITVKSQLDNSQLTNLPIIKEDKNINNERIEEKKEMEEVIITAAEAVSRSDIQSVLAAWNGLEQYGIKAVTKLKSGTGRYKGLVARIKEYSTGDVLTAIENIKQSSFLKGKNSRGWVITFDWFVRPNNFPKVLDGNYNGDSQAGNKNNVNASRQSQLEYLLNSIREDETNE